MYNQSILLNSKTAALVFSANTGPLFSVKGTLMDCLSGFGPNLSFFTVLFYLTYYAILDPIAAVSTRPFSQKKIESCLTNYHEQSLASPILFGMSYTATQFFQNNPKANKIAIIIHIVSWIFQFLGHGLAEKRSPKVLDNVVQGNMITKTNYVSLANLCLQHWCPHLISCSLRCYFSLATVQLFIKK